MPITVATGELLEMEIEGDADGQEVNNVIHYVVGITAGVPTLDDAVQALVNEWTVLVANLSDSYRFTGITGRRITGIDFGEPTFPFTYDSQHVEVFSSPLAGGVPGPALPTYVAASVRKVSAGLIDVDYVSPNIPNPPYTGERIFRGGMRLGTIPEDYTELTDQNKLTAAAIAALEPAITPLLNLLSSSGGGTNTASLDMVIASRVLALLGRADTTGFRTVAAYQPVDVLVLHPYVGSQVSRKRRPGGI